MLSLVGSFFCTSIFSSVALYIFSWRRKTPFAELHNLFIRSIIHPHQKNTSAKQTCSQDCLSSSRLLPSSSTSPLLFLTSAGTLSLQEPTLNLPAASLIPLAASLTQLAAGLTLLVASLCQPAASTPSLLVSPPASLQAGFPARFLHLPQLLTSPLRRDSRAPVVTTASGGETGAATGATGVLSPLPVPLFPLALGLLASLCLPAGKRSLSA